MTAPGLLETLTKSASAHAPDASPTGLRAHPVGSGRRRMWELRTTVAGLLPGHRVGTCGHRVIPGRAPAIWQHRDTGTHYYGGVRHCGAIWVCPYCAARVSRIRSEELRVGVEHAQEDGLIVTFLTFTAQHRPGHALRWLVDAATRAHRRMRGSRAWRRWAAAAGYRGSVRNLEVTWGAETGWHPHIHALWMTDHPLTDVLTAELRVLYATAAAREGLYVDEDAGLYIAPIHAHIEDYLAKLTRQTWAPADEVAAGTCKLAHAGRLMPLQIAAAAGVATDLVERDRYTRLWREYARAYRGRRQLYWSRGLRQLLRLGVELTDSEVTNQQTEDGVEVYVFTPRVWVRLRDSRRRLALLEAADAGGLPAIHALVTRYMGDGRVPGGGTEGWAPGTVVAWGVVG